MKLEAGMDCTGLVTRGGDNVLSVEATLSHDALPEYPYTVKLQCSNASGYVSLFYTEGGEYFHSELGEAIEHPCDIIER